MGTRDSAQDTLGTVHNAPAHTKGVLEALWKLQFADGHTWHQVFPLTGQGGPGLAGEFPGWPQWFSDDHLWLVFGTCHYLKETGDFGFLDQQLPFQDAPASSVWDHMQAAMRFTREHRGPHALPRLGFADWDDTLNLDHGSGLAESVWAGQLFCRVALDFAELAAFLGRAGEARHCASSETKWRPRWSPGGGTASTTSARMTTTGAAVGTAASEHHQVALNTQTWAVIGELDRSSRGKGDGAGPREAELRVRDAADGAALQRV